MSKQIFSNIGFFPDDIGISKKVVRNEKKNNIKKSDKIVSCDECGLHKTCKTPKMPFTGEGRLKILIVGEAPGKNEDENGIQFIGEAGSVLREALNALGYDLDKDFWKTNAVICRPLKNAKPKPLQIRACNKNLVETIDKLKPKVIIPLGAVAIDALIQGRKTNRIANANMGDWRGNAIPDQYFKCWICPSWHPSYLNRMRDRKGNLDSILLNQFQNDLDIAIKIRKTIIPIYNWQERCRIVKNEEKAIDIINKMREQKYAAFDYETTGKKPYAHGHKIVCVSISNGVRSYAFPYFNSSAFRNAFMDFLKDPNVGKIMHNAKFENVWGKRRAGLNDSQGTWTKNIHWDTMITAHILNNRIKTNLKFQSYINFGVLGYDDKIERFLQADAKQEKLYGANAFNRIMEADENDLLLYNAADSYLEYKLFECQKALMKVHPSLEKGRRLFLQGTESFSRSENSGIKINEELAEQAKNDLTNQMSKLENKVLESKELVNWDKPTAFRLSNPNDLSHLLFNVLQYKCKDCDRTETGKPKADYETMTKYKIQVVKDILKWRKLGKLKNTYLQGFIKENVDGFINPFFNLGTVDTFRSSSNAPNFQNNPKHDKSAMVLIRSLVIPRKNHILGEFDYKGIEVCMNACYNKDPILIAYINNPKTDMHRDMAMKLFLMDQNQITHDLRYCAKNGYVFPTFYGSYYENTAMGIWDSIDKGTKEYLKKKGIKNSDDYVDHVKSVDDFFWNKFQVAKEWTEKTIVDYKKKGFIELYTGFRCYGPMSKNQIINYRMQGSGFHCLLYTYNHVQKEMIKRKMKSVLIGQIHDAIYPDYLEEEEKEIDHLIWYYGTQKIREDWDWINVPLNIEKSRSAMNGNWSEMEECGLLKGGEK